MIEVYIRDTIDLKEGCFLTLNSKCNDASHYFICFIMNNGWFFIQILSFFLYFSYSSVNYSLTIGYLLGTFLIIDNVVGLKLFVDWMFWYTWSKWYLLVTVLLGRHFVLYWQWGWSRLKIGQTWWIWRILTWKYWMQLCDIT